MANKYEVDYNDKRLTDVKAEQQAQLNEVDVNYGNMISQSDKYYQDQINASQDWADKQTQLQQEKTDFAIDKIEQQKEQAHKDYLKEQSGAYVDWQKQSNAYGANAEQMAAAGLAGSGFSESSQVSMYNTYQNRVTVARESYNQIVMDFNNGIREAQLQNNSIMAEIQYEALQTRLELALQGFQYKNNLIREQADKKLELKKYYSSEYQNVLAQINREKEFAFQRDQAEIANKRQQEQLDLAKREMKLQEDKFAYQKSQDSKNSGSATITKTTGSSSKGSSSGSSKAKKSTTTITKAKSTTTKSASSKKSTKQIDMDSVLALGFGPISASRLNELVANGIVEEYTSGGRVKFRKTAKTLNLERLKVGF